MVFRPGQMKWVDILVNREDAPAILESLASGNLIQLQREAHEEVALHEFTDRDAVGRLHALDSRLASWRGYLPPPDPMGLSPDATRLKVSEIVARLETAFQAWRVEAEKRVRAITSSNNQYREMQELAKVIDRLPDDALDFADYNRVRSDRGSALLPLLFAGPPDEIQAFEKPPADCFCESYGDGSDSQVVVYVAVAPRNSGDSVEQWMRRCGAKPLSVPPTLEGRPAAAREQVLIRAREARARADRAAAELRSVNEQFGIAGLYWLLKRSLWVERILESAWRGEKFFLLGGWVPPEKVSDLIRRLERRALPFLIREDETPGHGPAPVRLSNRRWAKPFEAFVRGFGVPTQDEIDPTPILAVVTPVMFGYMFGDVGQGFCLVLAGVYLKRRIKTLGLLIPAGVSAMVFGLLYGSVFSLEHLIPPLWMHPMSAPLLILGLPVLAGVVLILLSLGLAALQAYWSGRLKGWTEEEVPALMLYLALASWLISPRLAVAFGVTAFAFWLFMPVAQSAEVTSVFSRLLVNLAHCVEKVVQLFINTLSFARLGAFALAHAGLSAAVVTLMEMPESALLTIGVFVVGNLVLTGLEGLVVSIQTTRLVMFEFYRRFLSGGGRLFRPLSMTEHPGLS
jgi:V/A-type H+-transporting ATPase subunit I